MSLTVSESSAVNVLCRYLLGEADEYYSERVTTEVDARDALALLAASSNKRLMAGYRPEQVVARWGTEHDRIAQLHGLLHRWRRANEIGGIGAPEGGTEPCPDCGGSGLAYDEDIPYSPKNVCARCGERDATETTEEPVIDGAIVARRAEDHGHIATCRRCGCNDNDCRECFKAQGYSCWWVVDPEGGDLCSRCATELGIPLDPDLGLVDLDLAGGGSTQ